MCFLLLLIPDWDFLISPAVAFDASDAAEWFRMIRLCSWVPVPFSRRVIFGWGRRVFIMIDRCECFLLLTRTATAA